MRFSFSMVKLVAFETIAFYLVYSLLLLFVLSIQSSIIIIGKKKYALLLKPNEHSNFEGKSLGLDSIAEEWYFKYEYKAPLVSFYSNYVRFSRHFLAQSFISLMIKYDYVRYRFCKCNGFRSFCFLLSRVL